MAEHFHGRKNVVHFSSGATEVLLRAWIKKGEKMESTPQAEAVLDFLRGRLHGGLSFSLDPPPSELADPDRLRCFAEMVAGFANDLARSSFDPELEIDLDRHLQLSWLARILDLYEVIDEALPPDAKRLETLTPVLEPCDRIACEYWRLEHRLTDLRRKFERRQLPSDPRAELDLVDRLLAILGQQASSRQRDGMIAHHLKTRGELLLSLGEQVKGLEALREAAAVWPDAELRRLLAEDIED